jgi:hypothetical protein
LCWVFSKSDIVHSPRANGATQIFKTGISIISCPYLESVCFWKPAIDIQRIWVI